MRDRARFEGARFNVQEVIVKINHFIEPLGAVGFSVQVIFVGTWMIIGLALPPLDFIIPQLW